MENQKKATRRDVALAAGVAASTVSRVMSDSPLITDDVKKKVLKFAAELGYVPSRQASLFALRQTKTLGLVVPSYGSFPPFSRPYFPTLLDGVVLAADAAGFAVTVVLDKVTNAPHDYYAMVESSTFDGLIFAVTKADYRPFLQLAEKAFPFVLVNNYLEGLNSVDARPGPGMRLAMDHLVQLGHSQVGFIQGDLRFRNASDRLEAFEELAAEFHLDTSQVTGDFSKTSGYQGADKLLSGPRPPSAIVTSSDRAAFGVMQYCRAHQIRIPEDLSLVGYDNLSPAEEVFPSLSTVDHPIAAAGGRAVGLLLSILAHRTIPPVQEWLDTGYVNRGSTGPAKGRTP